MVEEKGAESIAITTVPSKDLYHVQTKIFAQVQQAKKMLLKVVGRVHYCAQVGFNMLISANYNN